MSSHPEQGAPRHLVLVGGGHAHALVLREWGRRSPLARLRSPLPGVTLTVISQERYTPYSGMVPGHLGGRYSFGDAHIDLLPLTQQAGGTLLIDRAVGLDLAQAQVQVSAHPPIPYDLLSLDTGSTPVPLPQGVAPVIPAKPIPQLLAAWGQWLAELETQKPPQVSLVVVGGGAGGVELAGNLQWRLRGLMSQWGHSPQGVTVHLCQRAAALVPDRPPTIQQRVLTLCQRRGIQVHLGETVVAVNEIPGLGQQVQCASGLTLGADRVVWVTQAAAPAWLQGSGLAVDGAGFVQVSDTLQSCSHPQVFAVGDMATMVNTPRPKAGVFAVRQGPPLAHNLRAMLRGKRLRPFRPQQQYLSILDLGGGDAIATRSSWGWESVWASRWKTHLDRRFMALFPAPLP